MSAADSPLRFGVPGAPFRTGTALVAKVLSPPDIFLRAARPLTFFQESNPCSST
ncbi:hypothetical protein [Burkholderia metallica]|uniref:hypothetical protein n=1 Tax=Burkholderia metallica TaxID=488729 RepID=UPI00145438DA|nr:hypothetical protein [Burkholderia metallica]VWC29395.1 hypothetical protein BME24068_06288 [Burkholderia metallica]